MKTQTVKLSGRKLRCVFRAYENGRPAICLEEPDGSLWTVATVNLPDEDIPDGFVALKTWSENEGVFDALWQAGIVESPVRFVRTGYVLAPICPLTVKP